MTELRKKGKAVGLDDAEVERSRREHGANLLSRKKGKSFFKQFLSNLNDPVIRILLGALIVNLLLLFRNGDWMETVGIGIAVLLATFISTLSEYGSAKAFERLSEEGAKVSCRVRRRRGITEIPIADVVVGDTVLLGAGELIPADGLLTSGELRTDQSAMTGESREIQKRPSDNRTLSPASPSALFRGCTVTAGQGEMEVLAVGDASFLGEISKEIQLEQRESPLKVRLTKLAGQISKLGYLAAVLVAFAYLFNSFVLDSGMQWELIRLKLSAPSYLLTHILQAFTLGLTVLVVAVPEGLPMMIAVVLSSNIRKMIHDRVLVRKPVGIEAAGSMNILFTDKTGTLTEGKMKVSAFLDGKGRRISFSAFLSGQDKAAELAVLGFRFGTEASAGTDASGKASALGGSATDRAMLESVLSVPTPNGYRVLSRLPFDSMRKYSAVSLGGKQRLTLIIGAPERLLPHTQSVLCDTGTAIPLSRAQFEQAIRQSTQSGERVLALAVSQENLSAQSHASGIRGTLTLIGAVCISDPLRREAASSVAQLRDAGIQVVMITGDSKETARTLAARCGIVDGTHPIVLTGEELSKMTDQELAEMLSQLAVVARALPTDKSRLVRVAQECGLVCGMTGDGINDAPALRRADIGFAMGGGTQVAKDAGDIIILDNNLASIVKAVLYGRTIFKSIRKFIALQLTMNFCAVGVTVICPFIGIDAPVTVIQMLWINLIMDTLGGLAFAGEPPLAEYMREPPKRRDAPILNRYMVNEILLLGGFTVFLFLFFLKSPLISSVYRTSENRIYHLTAFFALFIFSSVFNCFNARSDRLKLFSGLGKNKIFLLIMLAILVIQIGFIYLGGSVLRTAPLTVRELSVTMLLSLSVFPADVIRKAIWRLRKKRGGY